MLGEAGQGGRGFKVRCSAGGITVSKVQTEQKPAARQSVRKGDIHVPTRSTAMTPQAMRTAALQVHIVCMYMCRHPAAAPLISPLLPDVPLRRAHIEGAVLPAYPPSAPTTQATTAAANTARAMSARAARGASTIIHGPWMKEDGRSARLRHCTGHVHASILFCWQTQTRTQTDTHHTIRAASPTIIAAAAAAQQPTRHARVGYNRTSEATSPRPACLLVEILCLDDAARRSKRLACSARQSKRVQELAAASGAL